MERRFQMQAVRYQDQEGEYDSSSDEDRYERPYGYLSDSSLENGPKTPRAKRRGKTARSRIEGRAKDGPGTTSDDRGRATRKRERGISASLARDGHNKKGAGGETKINTKTNKRQGRGPGGEAEIIGKVNKRQGRSPGGEAEIIGKTNKRQGRGPGGEAEIIGKVNKRQGRSPGDEAEIMEKANKRKGQGPGDEAEIVGKANKRKGQGLGDEAEIMSHVEEEQRTRGLKAEVKGQAKKGQAQKRPTRATRREPNQAEASPDNQADPGSVVGSQIWSDWEYASTANTADLGSNVPSIYNDFGYNEDVYRIHSDYSSSEENLQKSRSRTGGLADPGGWLELAQQLHEKPKKETGQGPGSKQQAEESRGQNVPYGSGSETRVSEGRGQKAGSGSSRAGSVSKEGGGSMSGGNVLVDVQSKLKSTQKSPNGKKSVNSLSLKSSAGPAEVAPSTSRSSRASSVNKELTESSLQRPRKPTEESKGNQAGSIQADEAYNAGSQDSEIQPNMSRASNEMQASGRQAGRSESTTSKSCGNRSPVTQADRAESIVSRASAHRSPGKQTGRAESTTSIATGIQSGQAQPSASRASGMQVGRPESRSSRLSGMQATGAGASTSRSSGAHASTARSSSGRARTSRSGEAQASTAGSSRARASTARSSSGRARTSRSGEANASTAGSSKARASTARSSSGRARTSKSGEAHASTAGSSRARAGTSRNSGARASTSQDLQTGKARTSKSLSNKSTGSNRSRSKRNSANQPDAPKKKGGFFRIPAFISWGTNIAKKRTQSAFRWFADCVKQVCPTHVTRAASLLGRSVTDLHDHLTGPTGPKPGVVLCGHCKACRYRRRYARKKRNGTLAPDAMDPQAYHYYYYLRGDHSEEAQSELSDSDDDFIDSDDKRSKSCPGKRLRNGMPENAPKAKRARTGTWKTCAPRCMPPFCLEEKPTPCVPVETPCEIKKISKIVPEMSRVIKRLNSPDVTLKVLTYNVDKILLSTRRMDHVPLTRFINYAWWIRSRIHEQIDKAVAIVVWGRSPTHSVRFNSPCGIAVVVERNDAVLHVWSEMIVSNFKCPCGCWLAYCLRRPFISEFTTGLATFVSFRLGKCQHTTKEKNIIIDKHRKPIEVIPCKEGSYDKLKRKPLGQTKPKPGEPMKKLNEQETVYSIHSEETPSKMARSVKSKTQVLHLPVPPFARISDTAMSRASVSTVSDATLTGLKPSSVRRASAQSSLRASVASVSTTSWKETPTASQKPQPGIDGTTKGKNRGKDKGNECVASPPVYLSSFSSTLRSKLQPEDFLKFPELAFSKMEQASLIKFPDVQLEPPSKLSEADGSKKRKKAGPSQPLEGGPSQLSEAAAGPSQILDTPPARVSMACSSHRLEPIQEPEETPIGKQKSTKTTKGMTKKRKRAPRKAAKPRGMKTVCVASSRGKKKTEGKANTSEKPTNEVQAPTQVTCVRDDETDIVIVDPKKVLTLNFIMPDQSLRTIETNYGTHFSKIADHLAELVGLFALDLQFKYRGRVVLRRETVSDVMPLPAFPINCKLVPRTYYRSTEDSIKIYVFAQGMETIGVRVSPNTQLKILARLAANRLTGDKCPLAKLCIKGRELDLSLTLEDMNIGSGTTFEVALPPANQPAAQGKGRK